ncbi:MAG: universal stress protein [Chloroflexota bacterium]
MYNRILAPLDGSELAECALEHIKSIAKGCSVPRVDLLYVVPPITPIVTEDISPSLLVDMEEDLENWGKNYLASVVKKLKKEDVAAEAVVLHGNVAESILDYARKNGVDLIIMSTHGRSGLKRLVLGSVTDRVSRLSSVPVLVVAPC